uniref:Uncharacterized protein n=1 Tax=Cyanophora sudae TaxID=1522369 RepID=A0A2Z4HFR5_9EUKA|nr:hypothetical protein [Cyanophora sudae]YP_009504488.1 hypothetical protein [Cyanophora sudae]AWW13604.1 hypothetical protein [Cyanophora sudae]AWW13605.1 hypothetical protein [Cyanophora sudae]
MNQNKKKLLLIASLLILGSVVCGILYLLNLYKNQKIISNNLLNSEINTKLTSVNHLKTKKPIIESISRYDRRLISTVPKENRVLIPRVISSSISPYTRFGSEYIPFEGENNYPELQAAYLKTKIGHSASWGVSSENDGVLYNKSWHVFYYKVNPEAAVIMGELIANKVAQQVDNRIVTDYYNAASISGVKKANHITQAKLGTFTPEGHFLPQLDGPGRGASLIIARILGSTIRSYSSFSKTSSIQYLVDGTLNQMQIEGDISAGDFILKLAGDTGTKAVKGAMQPLKLFSAFFKELKSIGSIKFSKIRKEEDIPERIRRYFGSVMLDPFSLRISNELQQLAQEVKMSADYSRILQTILIRVDIQEELEQRANLRKALDNTVNNFIEQHIMPLETFVERTDARYCSPDLANHVRKPMSNPNIKTNINTTINKKIFEFNDQFVSVNTSKPKPEKITYTSEECCSENDKKSDTAKLEKRSKLEKFLAIPRTTEERLLEEQIALVLLQKAGVETGLTKFTAEQVKNAPSALVQSVKAKLKQNYPTMFFPK